MGRLTRAWAVEDAGVQSDAHHAPSRIKILIQLWPSWHGVAGSGLLHVAMVLWQETFYQKLISPAIHIKVPPKDVVCRIN
jgi:hypothetical protein